MTRQAGAIDAITDYAEEVSVNDGERGIPLMQWLKRFMFEPSEQQKYIRTLSGESVAGRSWQRCWMRSLNFLIPRRADERSDIMTSAYLEEYLEESRGVL